MQQKQKFSDTMWQTRSRLMEDDLFASLLLKPELFFRVYRHSLIFFSLKRYWMLSKHIILCFHIVHTPNKYTEFQIDFFLIIIRTRLQKLNSFFSLSSFTNRNSFHTWIGCAKDDLLTINHSERYETCRLDFATYWNNYDHSIPE